MSWGCSTWALILYQALCCGATVVGRMVMGTIALPSHALVRHRLYISTLCSCHWWLITLRSNYISVCHFQPRCELLEDLSTYNIGVNGLILLKCCSCSLIFLLDFALCLPSINYSYLCTYPHPLLVINGSMGCSLSSVVH